MGFKKWLSLLCVVMALSIMIAGCGVNSVDRNDDQALGNHHNNENSNDASGQKLTEEVRSAYPFSEGLAFVSTHSYKGYFINKKGEIVIDLSEEPLMHQGLFVNGLSVMNDDGTLCNKNGKIIQPQDVGAVKLYGDALAGGYILAEQQEDSYTGTIHKIGVMDLNFNWLIEPSEENYRLLTERKGKIPSLNDYGNFYYKDYLWIRASKQYLNLKTFTFSDTWEYDMDPETWLAMGHCYYARNTYDLGKGTVVLELNTPTAEECSSFVHGKAAVLFYNKEAYQTYFTMIDTKGKFAFEPVEICNNEHVDTANIYYDGNYVIFVGRANWYIYNVDGSLAGSLPAPYDDSYPKIGEGIIVSGNKYYNMDGTPLF